MPNENIDIMKEVKRLKELYIIAIILIFYACSSDDGPGYQEPYIPNPGTGNGNGTENPLSDEELLDLVQEQTFKYFWGFAGAKSGLARERSQDDAYGGEGRNIVTTGGSGFGIASFPVAVERGWITRTEAVNRMKKILDFLETVPTYHGAFSHWYRDDTAQTRAFSEWDNGGDLVETALLMQGLLIARQYFSEDQEIVERITILWEAVEWDWYTKGGEDVLYWHWSPNHEWKMNFKLEGYNECLITYVLAASSPTYPIDPDVYHKGWARNDSIMNDTTIYGYETVLDYYEYSDEPVGPLFWAQYSFLGLDPRNLKDKYADYWKLVQNHALINYEHCVQNPNNHKGYGPKCWGLTASYSPDEGYANHMPTHDPGVISPTAALSSFPYTPEQSMDFLRFLYTEADTLVGIYGPYDAFSFEKDWYTPRYLALDQGTIPVMIENYRTGLLWELFMSAPEIKAGLDRLGFTSY